MDKDFDKFLELIEELTLSEGHYLALMNLAKKLYDRTKDNSNTDVLAWHTVTDQMNTIARLHGQILRYAQIDDTCRNLKNENETLKLQIQLLRIHYGIPY